MDRLSQLRGEAGGSGDSTLDTTSPPSEAFISANENSSKYFSISDSTFDITPIKDVSLASTSADADRSIAGSDELISNLSPIGKKELDSYKIGKQIEAANILSGGVDIFDGNDNSFDGNELVIDDNMEAEEKDDNQADVTPLDNIAEPEPALAEPETNVASREMEVVLQIDGNNVNAIDIGNGLYLYRKDGQDELAAIQIIDDDPQHSFKFLKVRDNAEGNLEVYEEIEIEVPKEVPTKEGKLLDKNTPHVPTVDIKKSMSDSSSTIKAEGKNKSPQKEPIASKSTSDKNADEKETSESRTDLNRNGKMMKFSDSRKSPVVGSFTPVTFHSTPNKEGKPLTKTMVDLQLDPNRHSDNVKKTIEVHTENIKQKVTELPVKEKETVENVKCVESILAEKEISTEKSNKVTYKQEVIKDIPKKEDERNITEVVECPESTEEIHKSGITTDKEKGTISKELVIKVQNKDSITNDSRKELIEGEMKSDNDAGTGDAVLEKEESPIKDKEIKMVVTNPDKLVVTLPPIPKEENENVISIPVTKQKLETTSELVVPAIKQLKPVEPVIEPIQNINKLVEKPTEKKSGLAESPVNATIPVDIERVKSITREKKEVKRDKPPKIKILENISLTFPTTSNSTDKPSTVEVDSHRVENSTKHDDDNNIKYPLESFSEVTSTCSNLGNEESKEESITLYSIDTDESVSLITPSSTTKIRDDKVVLSDKISEVLTTISNLSHIETENTSVKNEKPVVQGSSVLTKARNEADSTSKISEQACSSKLEKTKTAQTSNIQKGPKEIKERCIPVQETKLIEKATSSIPVPKVKNSEKLVPCNIVPKEKLSKLTHSTMMELQPHINKAQPSLAHEIKSPGKVDLFEIKPLAKPAAAPNIPASHSNPLEKPAKFTVDVKTVKPATKIASKPQEKAEVPASVVNPAEKKYSVPPAAKVTNTTSIPAKVKQLEISSATSNRTVKPDSHIPVVSVANKPSSKLIPVTSPKVEATTKHVDNAASQKEIAKYNILDKTSSNKNDTREIKEPIRKPNESKPVNNNHTAAVPFGKWTDAHRQEFVNKFKEVKAPHNTNSKQIKNSNDLNRRDVLQKIDSQRAQTISNATSKGQEKINVKSETMFSSKVVSPTVETKSIPYNDLADNKLEQDSTKVVTKQENPLKTTASSALSTSYAADVNAKMLDKTKPEPTGQTTFAKIKPTPKEQSTVSKTEPASKEQSTVCKTEPVSKDQTSVNKTETAPRDQNTASCYMASLIDRTIEDMINKVAPGKNMDEAKPNIVINSSESDPKAQKPVSTQVSKLTVNDVSLDDIEMKMNELHGIPFVERPPHELPKILKPEIKTYSKTDKTKPISTVSKITNTDYTTCDSKLVKDLDSDEEIIEHEPITGDLDLKILSVPIKVTSEANKNVSVKSITAIADKHASNKEAEIITEREFDKFARRNSITYENENCLTVNIDRKEPRNVVQTIKGKDLTLKVNPKLEPSRSEVKSQLHIQTMRHNIQTDKSQGGIHGSITSDSSNKKYQSKIHSAYQSALTAKHQVSRPISIIEDKPVKVVFLESSIGFVPSQLNVQGQELSPAKKPEAEVDTHITANNDSVDSGMSEAIYENKQQEKTKTKHQRKQVLTPVEAPDLELIQPSDIGIETTSKKKRKVEDVQAKSLVPKKSYLLGRSTATEDKIASIQVTVKDNTKHIIKRSEDVPEHNDTASAIDNLVKAAELLDNQAESAHKSISPNPASQTNTPVKRGRGRPRKYPLPDGAADDKTPSPQKKPRLIDAKPIKQDSISDEQDDDSSEEAIIRENWTMGKINENIVCPICNKLFRSENVVFKHVKHCTGVSPNRSESDKKSPHRFRLSQESDDMDIEYEMSSSESKTDTPKKCKSKESANSDPGTPGQTKLDLGKYDVIVIEDTPIKENSEKLTKETEEEPKKESKAKVPQQNKSLVCEFCGKTFRQQSYLTSHKLQHKKDLAKKREKDIQESNKLQVFSCEVCKKEFRKLHHLVQHRINHNPDNVPKRALRKSLSEQNDTKNLKEDAVVKQVEDASAGFRCEPCDKSFRKLHHLVEHRGTHDGINRQKPSASVQPTVEKPPPPPQCEICKKTFRKLHHLIEHKEQHVETSSDKSDDKSAKSALSTKDIIHECSVCYMVFPNEHSLNKHSGICSKKKRQSKQAKDTAENSVGKDDVKSYTENKKVDIEGADIPKLVVNDDNIAKEQDSEEVKKSLEVEKIVEVDNHVVTEVKQNDDEKITSKEVSDKPLVKEEVKSIESLSTPVKRDLTKSDINKDKDTPVVPEKIKKIDLKEAKAQDIPKKKTVLKDKGTQHVTKRQQSIDAPIPAVTTNKPSVESSDDDEIRYMLNPNFKVDEASGKTFMKVRARKRNSLQIERPNSNDHAKRRTSLQLPPKVSRLKPKAVEMKPRAAETNSKSTETKSKPTETKTSTAPPMKVKHVPKISEAEAVLSTDSDDSDVKYSFPKTVPETSKPPKETEKKIPRKSLVEKRKSLASIARRKSSGKAITAKHKDNPPSPKPIKRRTLGVEHRCDCGELFSSAALLVRHASLAHTPPRIRRRRDPPAPAPAPQDEQKPARKPSTRSEAPPAAKPTRKSTVRKPEPATQVDSRNSLKPTQIAPKTRRSAHSGVPVPEKMRKLMQKNVK